MKAASRRRPAIWPDISGLSPASLRDEFRRFCGEDRYRKFASVIWMNAFPKQRLMYWQQQLWREFSAASSQRLPTDFGAIRKLFNICPLHLCELELLSEEQAVPVSHQFARARQDIMLKEAPFAIVAVTRSRDAKPEIVSCPECRHRLDELGG